MSSFENPLLSDWPHGLPPFSSINASHFKPAFDVAMSQHLQELKDMVENPELPTFENTISAFDRAGRLFSRVEGVYSNLCLSDCKPELQAVELELAGPLEAHKNAQFMFDGLFARIDQVYGKRLELGLTLEQQRLVEKIHLEFVRNGAKFGDAAKEEYAKITERLAELQIQFSQNVMADESSFTLDLTEDDLTGLPAFVRDAAKQAAIERNKPEGVYSITLSRSLVVPFITYSDRRDLRQSAWTAWSKRGELEAARDNKPLILEILKLRAKQATMHGYNNFADYSTANTMAGSPDAVMELLERVWTPAKSSAGLEREALKSLMLELGVVDQRGDIEPWDWRYYAEKVRHQRYDFDEGEVKPYLSLDCMCAAVFDCANRLFGLRFIPRTDVETYHPDVRVYEVTETVPADSAKGTAEAQRTVGIFFHDNFARPNKKSGAWMSEFRSQSRNINGVEGEFQYPIVINNNNFNKGSATEPTLLSFDDAVTLFHEFGHGLHGLLSDVTYNRLASTNVLKDWVELPSQLFEHWLSESVVLKKHALHHVTGEPIPDDLLARMWAAKNFNQGFNTIEYTACALLDQAIHKLTATELEGFDVSEFERKELARLGMPQGIIMRHRPTHFQHLFCSHEYASGYYVYLWAEVLDADGFDAFLEAGDCFDVDTAHKVRRYVYSSGSSLDHREAYKAFRGREPAVEPMLRKKGLLV